MLVELLAVVGDEDDERRAVEPARPQVIEQRAKDSSRSATSPSYCALRSAMLSGVTSAGASINETTGVRGPIVG